MTNQRGMRLKSVVLFPLRILRIEDTAHLLSKLGRTMNRLLLMLTVSFYLNLAAGVGLTFAQTAEEWNKQGVGFVISRDFDKAIYALTKAIELDAKNADAFGMRGACYMVVGKLPEAIADFTKAIELNPQNVTAYSNRAQAYHLSSDLNRALADYRTAARLRDKKAQDVLNEAGVPW